MKLEIEKIINSHLENKMSLGEAVSEIITLLKDSDWNNASNPPKEYGKYFVCRKDGKVHWETWNGIGWAYNGNTITHWRKIEKPF